MQEYKKNWTFCDRDDDFHFKMKLENHSNFYYFPLCNERFHASITPILAGSASLDINSFLLKPVTEEELLSSNHSRNFWINFDDKSWSATGNSLLQKAERSEVVTVKGGLLWHEVERVNQNLGIQSNILNFVPATSDALELMRVTITNLSDKPKEITGISGIPIYARSADNIRDHNHVTSLLHRTHLTNNGVIVHPTLSFDERGHIKNHLRYQVYGVDKNGDPPVEIIPVRETFMGNGSLDWPDYVINNKDFVKPDEDFDGRYAIAALKFKPVVLGQGESTSFYLLLGIDNVLIDHTKFLGEDNFNQVLRDTKRYWGDKVSSVNFVSSNEYYDNWLKWVTLQPVLRRIYGNSFLPHHDYGRGGRGWRDLWQDILSLILVERQEVRNLLITNFAGIRLDGSNATVIGSNPGDFKADRNNIPRVWMDHGAWPLYTTNFYINQTGDLEILLQEQSYFNDQHIFRCKRTNPYYKESIGTRLHTKENKVHFATIFEHLLIQNLTSCFNVGIHNNILLEGGDWNDALDMAREYGESVAFTSFYANNLRILVGLLTALEGKGRKTIKLTEELMILVDPELDLENPNEKQELLQNYFEVVSKEISGEFREIEIGELIDYLSNIADFIIDHLNSNEIVTSADGHSWYNGYYDNIGDPFDGDFNGDVRMSLTGQVFPLAMGIVKEEQVQKVVDTVNEYLFDENIGGLRLNTDFSHVKTNLGRAFGFAYGHKENGAMFSHMEVIYIYGLYKNHQVHEGYKLLDHLFAHLCDTDRSFIYPNLPEYINQQGRGMYSYLTGSASWMIYLMVTQVYGIRGNLGDILIEPKLLDCQFKNGEAKVFTAFRELNIDLIYEKSTTKDYDDYCISGYEINGTKVDVDHRASICFKYIELESQSQDHHITLKVFLD